MNITKRDGRTETFDQAKIRAAIDKAFQNSGVFPSDARLDEIVASVVNSLSGTAQITVEGVQDKVEECLMSFGYYKTAKAYILYRESRAGIRTERQKIVEMTGDETLEPVLRSIQ